MSHFVLLLVHHLEPKIMLTMPLRKQGGAAVVTIPPSLLNQLDLKVGSELQMEVREGTLVMLPSKRPRRVRYSLEQLLEGVTPANVKALNIETAWAREGDAQGRELI
jgi:antitoxin ChpS